MPRTYGTKCVEVPTLLLPRVSILFRYCETERVFAECSGHGVRRVQLRGVPLLGDPLLRGAGHDVRRWGQLPGFLARLRIGGFNLRAIAAGNIR